MTQGTGDKAQAQTQPGHSFRISALGTGKALPGLGFALWSFLGVEAEGQHQQGLQTSALLCILPLSEGQMPLRVLGTAGVRSQEGGCGRLWWECQLVGGREGGLFIPAFLSCLLVPYCPLAPPYFPPTPHSLVLFGPRGAVVGARHLHQGRCETL